MADQTPNIHKKKRERSPSYPAVDLETAIAKTRVLYEKEGKHFAPLTAVAQNWGCSPKSGTTLVTLAALKKFGLIEDEGSLKTRQVRVSGLAQRILLDDRPDSRDRREAIKEAALRPSIHAEIWEKYGALLPSEANLRFYLRTEKGFTDSAASDLVQEFQRTITFARLGEPDTLSMPGADTAAREGDTRILTPQPQLASATPLGPQGERAVQLPLSATMWATLQAPFPLSEQAWKQMIAVLEAMKPALVSPSGQGTQTTKEDE